MKKQTCVICKKEFVGFGNNAYPIAEGRCCDECNAKVVNSRIEKLKNQIDNFKKPKGKKDFKVIITENFSGEIMVEAYDRDDAIKVAQRMIADNEIPSGTTDKYTSGYQVEDAEEITTTKD